MFKIVQRDIQIDFKLIFYFQLFTEKLTSEFLFQEMREAELYTKLERWPEANAAYKKLLKEK